MKKRLLFILIVFIAWLPVFVIQKPVFMFYQHALSEACTFTDFLQVMLHGLKLDCTIAGYLTAIPLLLTLAYIIHSGFISGYQNRYGDNLKPPTNVYHRMTA